MKKLETGCKLMACEFFVNGECAYTEEGCFTINEPIKRIETIVSEVQGEINVKADVCEYDVEMNCDSIMSVFKHYEVNISDYQKKRIEDDLKQLVEEQMITESQKTIEDISSRVDDIKKK